MLIFFFSLLVINGGHTSTPNEVERKRNYKLLIDPVLKGRGHQKIYRFDGDFEGVRQYLNLVKLISPNAR